MITVPMSVAVSRVSVSMSVGVNEMSIPMEIGVSEVFLPVEISVAYVSNVSDPYLGEYEVQPTFDDQILETGGLYMRDDVTVNEIPVARVSNLSGGKTITIG